MKTKWSIAGGSGLPTSPGSFATRHCAEPLRMSQYLWEICGNVPENGPKIEYIIVTLECTVLAIHLVEIGDCERTAFRSAPASAVCPSRGAYGDCVSQSRCIDKSTPASGSPSPWAFRQYPSEDTGNTPKGCPPNAS